MIAKDDGNSVKQSSVGHLLGVKMSQSEPTKQDSVYVQRAFRDKHPSFLYGSVPLQGCRYSFNQIRTGCRSEDTDDFQVQACCFYL